MIYLFYICLVSLPSCPDFHVVILRVSSCVSGRQSVEQVFLKVVFVSHIYGVSLLVQGDPNPVQVLHQPPEVQNQSLIR